MPSLQSQLAGGTINICCFLTQDTAHENRVIQAVGATLPIVGVSANFNDRNPDPNLSTPNSIIAATIGRPVAVHPAGESSVDIQVGAVGVTAGDLLTSDASGNAITAVSGNWVGARALATVPAGAFVRADVLSPFAKP